MAINNSINMTCPENFWTDVSSNNYIKIYDNAIESVSTGTFFLVGDDTKSFRFFKDASGDTFEVTSTNDAGYLLLSSGVENTSATAVLGTEIVDRAFTIGGVANSTTFHLGYGEQVNTPIITFSKPTYACITMPLQPAFLAFNSSPDANVSGAGTTYSPMDFDTERFDQNGDFASDVFTAPVTGKYFLTLTTTLYGITAANFERNEIVTSNRSYLYYPGSPVLIKDATYVTVTHSCIADMDASDTAVGRITTNGETTDINDIFGANSTVSVTHISGFLAQ